MAIGRPCRDLRGKRFGILTAVKRIGTTATGASMWLCRCDCGKDTRASVGNLSFGSVRSCGCRRSGPRIDLTGTRVGRLRVIEPAEKKKKRAAGWYTYWRCLCDCGTEKLVEGSMLRSESIRSCGCLLVEKTIERSTKHGHANAGRISPTYNSWSGMLNRCRNTSHKDYKNYGGRGISVCRRWQTFSNFLSDMGEKPKDKSIDRIDVNGNYSPKNCRWATAKEQAKNKRKRTLIR